MRHITKSTLTLTLYTVGWSSYNNLQWLYIIWKNELLTRIGKAKTVVKTKKNQSVHSNGSMLLQFKGIIHLWLSHVIILRLDYFVRSNIHYVRYSLLTFHMWGVCLPRFCTVTKNILVSQTNTKHLYLIVFKISLKNIDLQNWKGEKRYVFWFRTKNVLKNKSEIALRRNLTPAKVSHSGLFLRNLSKANTETRKPK